MTILLSLLTSEDWYGPRRVALHKVTITMLTCPRDGCRALRWRSPSITALASATRPSSGASCQVSGECCFTSHEVYITNLRAAKPLPTKHREIMWTLLSSAVCITGLAEPVGAGLCLPILVPFYSE